MVLKICESISIILRVIYDAIIVYSLLAVTWRHFNHYDGGEGIGPRPTFHCRYRNAKRLCLSNCSQSWHSWHALACVCHLPVILPLFGRRSWALVDIVKSLPINISQSQENNDTILRHPVYALWRDCDPHPPAYSLEPQSPRDTLLARCAAWREAVKAENLT